MHYDRLSDEGLGEPSGAVRECMEAAQKPQKQRFARASLTSNADMGPAEVRQFCSAHETGSEYTVTVEGRVSDADTGMTIPSVTILVVTVVGSYQFMGGLFEISFPAETMVNIRARAPGYKGESRQVKAHYERNVELDMEITLERIPTR